MKFIKDENSFEVLMEKKFRKKWFSPKKRRVQFVGLPSHYETLFLLG